MAPVRLMIRRGSPGQQNLGRVPVGSAQGPDGVDRARNGSVRDLLRALGLGLVDRDAEQGRVAADRQRRDGAPVLDAQVRHERAQGVAHRLRMLHQAPDHAERQDRCAPADQKPEMRAVRAGHAQGEQPAQGGMRDHVRPIVEEARVEPRLPDDRIGIDAEIAQGRHDFLGDPQVNVAGGKPPPGSARTLCCGGANFSLPTLVGRGTDVVGHRHVRLAEI